MTICFCVHEHFLRQNISFFTQKKTLCDYTCLRLRLSMFKLKLFFFQVSLTRGDKVQQMMGTRMQQCIVESVTPAFVRSRMLNTGQVFDNTNPRSCRKLERVEHSVLIIYPFIFKRSSKKNIWKFCFCSYGKSHWPTEQRIISAGK